MNRFIERWYPIIFSLIFIVLFHFILMPTFQEKILNNIFNIISVVSTLSGVMLGFVGVIIGVIVSINDSNLMKFIQKVNANELLKEYIRVAFYINIGTLITSQIILFIVPEKHQLTPWFCIDILVFLLLLMILTSYRIINLLFYIANINKSAKNENNLWNEEPYSPDKV